MQGDSVSQALAEPIPTVAPAAPVQWTDDHVDEAGALDDFTGWAAPVGAPTLFRMDGWMHPAVRCWIAELGDASGFRGLRYKRTLLRVTCTGRGWRDDAFARFVTVCEGLERAAALGCDFADFVYGSAADLGPEAMDTEGMARFSPAEIAGSEGALTTFVPDRIYRWYEGVDLHTGRSAYLPAVMTFLPGELLDGERFWLPLSTGVALHATMEQAIAGGICEVAERDAAALCWLQKLPLPLLDPAALLPETAEIVRWFAERGVRTLVFDATTDLGIPAAWCLQLCDDSELVGQGSATAAALDSAGAAHKAVLECVNAREFHRTTAPPPRAYRQFKTIVSGAVHMSRRSRRSAFDFLLDRLDERPVSPGKALPAGTPAEALASLLGLLAERGEPVYAADLTSREARQAGMYTARAVLPRLVPMSLRPPVKYAATPRLYEAPARMGYPVRPESRLTPYPIPLG
jgi:ribosomal protein S12 methylthiotransferase accessory factor